MQEDDDDVPVASTRPPSPEPVAPAPHRGDIQGLRAVAVLLVVLSHMGIATFAGGYIGVDVFFVVSGFLITGLLLREAVADRTVSLIDFYARRARRILPAASVVLLTTILAALFLLGRLAGDQAARDSIWAALFSINWKFSAEGTNYFASSLPPSPLQHYWSLAVEEQFYLVWPALVFLALFLGKVKHKRKDSEKPARRSRPRADRWRVLLYVTGGLTAASLAYSVLATAATPAAAYFSSFTRAYELGAGALLAIAAARLPLERIPTAVRVLASWAGIAGILVASVRYDEATPFPGSAALLPVLATVLVIAGGTGAPRAGAGLVLGTPPFQWLGDRSYSLYLWHWPILIIAAAYLGADLDLIQATVLMLGALVLTMITYALIEVPVHRGRGFATSRRNSLLLWPTSFAVLTTAVVILIGIAQPPMAAVAGSGFLPPSAAATTTTATPTEAAVAPTTVPPAVTTTGAPVPTQGVADSVVAAVAAGAAAARRSDPIPDALAPPVATARDVGWETAAPAECIPTYDQTSSTVCHFGPDVADTSIVIIGDSHAGMFLPALHAISDASGWQATYLIKGGCTATDVVAFRPASGEGRQSSCTEWRTWALGQIEKLAPDLVIISDAGTKSLNDPDGNEAAERTPEHASLWEAGMTSTIHTLQGYGSQVAVMAETPEGERDPITCLDRPTANLGDCAFDIGDSVTQLNDTNVAVTQATGAVYIDAVSWLCADTYCPIVVDGMITQYDSQHLTPVYSAALAGTLQAALPLS